ncbi:MAG: helix-turn-helix transcriptional regulator [Gammaproteobacteria bacterium]|nr:helix-turn-helix transcriptional regulator [Gammaproteobacteria bacterium]MCP5299726.1 helix-turn-helix transcriptional regulator [Chromatiaceae bacterium]
MKFNIAFGDATSSAIARALCQRLEAIRLAQNISQAELATEAGVSRSTLTRIADGRSVSLDSFIRVMQALGLSDHLATLLPDPEIRPVERVRRGGRQRRRASGKRKPTRPWTWGDDESDA